MSFIHVLENCPDHNKIHFFLGMLSLSLLCCYIDILHFKVVDWVFVSLYDIGHLFHPHAVSHLFHPRVSPISWEKWKQKQPLTIWRYAVTCLPNGPFRFTFHVKSTDGFIHFILITIIIIVFFLLRAFFILLLFSFFVDPYKSIWV